jgi:hypothetical protein
MSTSDYITYPIKIMLWGFTFKRKYIILEENSFSHNDRCYKYEQITNLYYSYEESIVNFIPNTKVWLGLRISDGKSILSFEGGLKKNIENVKNAYKILQKRSSDNRAKYYINQLVTNGYFDYNYGPESSMEKLDNFFKTASKLCGTIRIYNNGFLEHNNKRFDLKIAKSRGLLQVGYRRGVGLNVQQTTFGILISEQGFGIVDSKFAFESFWDTEIIHYIISELADGKKF